MILLKVNKNKFSTFLVDIIVQVSMCQAHLTLVHESSDLISFQAQWLHALLYIKSQIEYFHFFIISYKIGFLISQSD